MGFVEINPVKEKVGWKARHHRLLRLLRVLICCIRSKMAPGTLGEAAKRNQGQGHRDNVARYDRLRIKRLGIGKNTGQKTLMFVFGGKERESKK